MRVARLCVGCLSFAVLSLLASPPAQAKGTSFGSSLLFSPGAEVQTTCFILNLGPRSIAIFDVRLLTAQDPAAPDTNTCTNAPLAPNASCSFGGSAGVYGGGMALVGGNTKYLRG